MSEPILSRLKRRSQGVVHRFGLRPDWYLTVLGAVIGAVTGLGAIGFAEALYATEDWAGQTREHWPLWTLPIIPMVGALATGLLVHYFASEARGHGVPQVLDALIRKKGRIPTKIGVIKVIASICTVGSGGSAGAEGPIIQIGATAGSAIGRRVGVNREHMSTLVACGAAAGIASIFNAPIAGVFFALEILVRDFSLKTFTPVVIAAVFATAVTQVYHGENEAIFASNLFANKYVFTPGELPGYVVLGFLCALVAVGFTHLLHVLEDFFADLRLHPVFKPVIGALLLGLLGVAYTLMTNTTGQTPVFFGNGYETIRHLLEPDAYTSGGIISLTASLLALLVVCKAIATVLTLGSGGSGGVFAPSLFLGATTGGVFGMALSHLGLISDASSPASYALVGMAAVVAGATFAPMTAILLLFELTREPYVLAPIMLAAIVSTIVARRLMPDSIYTSRLRRAGILIGTGRDLTLLRRVPVLSVQVTPLPPEPVYPSDPLSKLITLHAHHNVPDFVVVDQEGKYIGMVTGSDMRTALIDREAIPLLLVAELMQTGLPTISPDEALDTVLDKFARHDVASLCLMHDRDPSRPMGLVSRSSVMARYQRALEES
ncbi:MAG: chloride channel protein [Phycisphaerales bacterium]